MKGDQTDPGGGWVKKVTELLGLTSQQAGLVKVLAFALALGILFMTAGDLFGINESRRPSSGGTAVERAEGGAQDELNRIAAEMARNLEESLGHIAGAGKVRVHITLSAGPTVSGVTDTRVDKTETQEQAGDNSTRKTVTTNQTTTNVMVKSGGADTLAVSSKRRAEIAGVVVSAEGAQDARVKERLFRAAVTALGIAEHKVQVEPGDGR